MNGNYNIYVSKYLVPSIECEDMYSNGSGHRIFTHHPWWVKPKDKYVLYMYYIESLPLYIVTLWMIAFKSSIDPLTLKENTGTIVIFKCTQT